MLWMVLVAAYAYVAWHRIQEPFPSAVIAVLGGTFAWALVASFIGFFTGGRDRAALRGAVNADPLRDGRLGAANGPIRPPGTALEGPFTVRPSVIYQYAVETSDDGQ